MTSQIILAEVSDPGAPASGRGKVFVQSDGNFYFRNDAGNKYRLNLGNASDVVLIANGGTGLSSYTAGDTLYYASSTALSKLAIGTSGAVMVSNGSAPTWGTVDDTGVGNRVLQFYRRQGNDPNDWSSAGTSTQTPGQVRKQAGVRALTITSDPSIDTTITFPTAFSNIPIIESVLRVVDPGNNQEPATVSVHTITATNFVLRVETPTGDSFTDTNNMVVMWSAVGPE
jgi:hypothetical protein